MRVTESVEAWGHSKIRANHRTTFEITKDQHLTERGDCVVAVGATKGAADLSREFKELLRNNSAKVAVTIEVEGYREVASGRGCELFSLTHPKDLVARKSRYVCPRTFMSCSDKAACDFPRTFVNLLRHPNRRINITLLAEI